MIIKTLLILAYTSFLVASSCNHKNDESLNKKDDIQCKKFNKKHMRFVIAEQNDSALYYIDKAILCNPENENYKLSKTRFLVQLNKYEEAENVILTFKNPNDPINKIFIGILKLKTNDKESENILRKSYSELENLKNQNSNYFMYKIALDNYYKGKAYSLNQVIEFKKVYTSAYETQNINALEENIVKNEKEEVLFKLLNIK